MTYFINELVRRLNVVLLTDGNNIIFGNRKYGIVGLLYWQRKVESAWTVRICKNKIDYAKEEFSPTGVKNKPERVCEALRRAVAEARRPSC